MILDNINNSPNYEDLHPDFKTAFSFLLNVKNHFLPDGRYEIKGSDVFALISNSKGRGMDGAALEAHKKYIDIQYVVSGQDYIGWQEVKNCKSTQNVYNPEKDITFFKDKCDNYFTVNEGEFAVFFPHDAHAPLAGQGETKKIVIKIAV